MRKTTTSAPSLSLREQLMAHEHERHAVMLACIKGAAALIDQLDQVRPAIQAAGATVHTHATVYGTGRERALGVSSGGLCASPAQEAKLLHVLLAMGFDPYQVTRYSSYALVYLKKGRLRLVHTNAPADACLGRISTQGAGA